MNDLILSLNQPDIGGSLGDNLINHICYADDLCLIALSSSGMQHLLDFYVICMLLTINYLTMQQNHFLNVLNQTELKLNQMHLCYYVNLVIVHLM